MSKGRTASIEPEAWKIVDGKLYLNHSKRRPKEVGAGRAWEYRQGRKTSPIFTNDLREVGACRAGGGADDSGPGAALRQVCA
jgi:hypothetical protein